MVIPSVGGIVDVRPQVITMCSGNVQTYKVTGKTYIKQYRIFLKHMYHLISK